MRDARFRLRAHQTLMTQPPLGLGSIYLRNLLVMDLVRSLVGEPDSCLPWGKGLV